MLTQPAGQPEPLEDQINGYDRILGTHKVSLVRLRAGNLPTLDRDPMPQHQDPRCPRQHHLRAGRTSQPNKPDH